MIAEIEHRNRRLKVDLAKPIDLSLPLHAGDGRTRAWWVEPVSMEAVVWEGKPMLVAEGSSVNFRNIRFNPHGHGTHTESVGHISPEVHPVGGMLDRYFFVAQVVSVRPLDRRTAKGVTDHVITLGHLREAIGDRIPEALVIRTVNGDNARDGRDWSGSNPPYLEAQACEWLRSIGVLHLLLDLPSVDRESDGGALAAHHAFWDHPNTVDLKRTITELIQVPREVVDGDYLLELQFPHFMNDAAPSRPVLYALI